MMPQPVQVPVQMVPVQQPGAQQVVVGQHVGSAGAVVAQPGAQQVIDPYAPGNYGENPNSDAQLANYDPAAAKK